MIVLILIAFLIISSLFIFNLPQGNLHRKIYTISTIYSFVFSILILFLFTNNFNDLLIFNRSWLPGFGIAFSFRVDWLSVIMILSVTIVFLGSAIVPNFRKINQSNTFYGLLLLLEAALLGVFTANDAIVFYIFWELVLFPVFFISLLWGSGNRIRLTLKFFIYTLVGSLTMLVGIIFLYNKVPDNASFAIENLNTAVLTGTEQIFVFLCLFLGFAIKTPIIPFHSWQPAIYDHLEYPSNMIVAALLSKMGIFGIIRFLPVMNINASILNPIGFVLLAGAVYAGIAAIRQTNMKKLLAYASISHLSLIVTSLLIQNGTSIQGSVIQIFAHSINVSALFGVHQILFSRNQNYNLNSIGRISQKAPVFAICTMIITLGFIGLPLTNSFPGEFLMLAGIFQAHHFMAILAGCILVLSAIYMLWFYQRVFYAHSKTETIEFQDLNRNEFTFFLFMGFWVIFTGVFPKAITFIFEKFFT